MISDAEKLEALEALADQAGYQALETVWRRSYESALTRVTQEIISDSDRAQQAALARAYSDVLTLRERTIKRLQAEMNNKQGSSMADDGIGGSDGFDPMTDQQDMVEGGFRPDPNVEENESNGDEGRLDWLEGADDEIAQYVQSKGFKDPAALAKSYREAESRMRQHDAELERLKEQNQQNEDYIGRLIELAERNQQMGGMQQQQPDPEAEIRQQLAAIGQAYQAGQIDEVGAEIARMQLFQQVINQNNQQLSSQFEEKLQSALGQYVAPLQDRMAHDDLNSAAAEMHEEYGPDVSQEALQLIKSGRSPRPDEHRQGCTHGVSARRRQDRPSGDGRAARGHAVGDDGPERAWQPEWRRCERGEGGP